MNRPFVVTLASEKGGVGKTTIATNLAVYLKALREELPVTIISFDNHFTLDQMFALGARPERSVADLLAGCPAADTVSLGQYGVQFVASSRRLHPPAQAPGWLRQRLGEAGFAGILILDTRPILDWFSEAALLAADLVLTPVKDRAALVNAGALRQVLAAEQRTDRLWLLPSLVDSRARLNAEVRVHEFLAFAARERDYQVLDLFISKSPKVEGLASGFSSRVRPVLTHARNTAVHDQLKQLAEFVLDRYAEETDDPVEAPAGDVAASGGCLARRRQVRECPCCCRHSELEQGHRFFDLRSRRRGLVHSGCFAELVDGLGQFDLVPTGLLALTLDGPGLVEPDCRLSVHQIDADGHLDMSEEVDLAGRPQLDGFLSMATGRSLQEAYRELILVDCQTLDSQTCPADKVRQDFSRRRRQAARALRAAGFF